MSTKCSMQQKCKVFKNGKCVEDDCIKLFKINAIYDKSELTEEQQKFHQLVLDDDKIDKKAYENLKKYSDNITDFVNSGKNIFIYSNICGNGKTEWSIKLLQSYVNANWHMLTTCDCHVLFINVPRFLLASKANITSADDYYQRVKDNVLEADLVVWDDIGSKGFTEFENENLYTLITMRLDLGKANIYNSNITGNSLRDRVGDRLFSRIYNSSEFIEFKGKDKRKLSGR